MLKYPIVTIGVASYNNASYVITTLEAIATQTYPAIRLFIVDDGSSDASVELIQGWLDTYRSRFSGGVEFYQQANQGITGVLNRILENTRSPYVVLLGSDDVLLPPFLDTQVAHLEAHPEAMLAHSNYAEIDERGTVIVEMAYPIDWPPADLDYPDALINGYQDRSIVLHSPTALYRRSVFDEVGYYNTNFVQEDLDMLLRITERYPVVYDPQVLLQYRILPNSLSRSPERQVRIQSDKIKLLHHLESEGRLLPAVYRGLAFGYLRLFLLTFNDSPTNTRAQHAAKIFQYGDSLISQADKQVVINRCYVNDFPLCRKLFQQFGWRSGNWIKDLFIRAGFRLL